MTVRTMGYSTSGDFKLIFWTRRHSSGYPEDVVKRNRYRCASRTLDDPFAVNVDRVWCIRPALALNGSTGGSEDLKSSPTVI